MGIHLVSVCEEPDGEEMIAAIWCCSQHCMVNVLAEFGVDFNKVEMAGIINLPDGRSLSYGGYPCGEESDYDAFCPCGELVRERLMDG